MKTMIATMFAVLISTSIAGCAADTSAQEPDAPADTTTSDLSKSRVVVLKDKADRTISNGPTDLTVTADAGNAKAKVTDDNPNAKCTVKRVVSQSTSKKTTFAISIDYTTDSGWNGCTIEFTAPSYTSTLTVGFEVDD